MKIPLWLSQVSNYSVFILHFSLLYDAWQRASHRSREDFTCPYVLNCPLIPSTKPLTTGPWNARSATVLGQRGAWIFSTENAVHNAITATTAGVSVSRISNGDVLNLSSYQITPAGNFLIVWCLYYPLIYVFIVNYFRLPFSTYHILLSPHACASSFPSCFI